MNTMSNLSGRLCSVGAALWLGVSAAAMAQQPSGETPPAPVPVAPVAPVAARPTKPATHSNAQLDAGEPRAETSPAGAEPRSSTAVGRVEPRHAAGSVGGAKTGVDRVDLSTATVTGSQEQPKVMYIVPWKRADIGDNSGKPMNSLLDEALAPVDRDEFKREVAYYDALQSSAPPHGTATVTSQGEK